MRGNLACTFLFGSRATTPLFSNPASFSSHPRQSITYLIDHRSLINPSFNAGLPLFQQPEATEKAECIEAIFFQVHNQWLLPEVISYGVRK